jgi:8-oxo-dGTP pyrophosphatase MutT (NUDIX family)
LFEMKNPRAESMTLAAGVVVVRNEDGQWRYLFLRAYQNWDFPKGIVKAGESPLHAAVREVREESGIADLEFRWGEEWKETAPYSSGGKKVARYYVAETPTAEVKFSVNPELGRPEHHEFRWVTYEELRRLAPARLRPIVEWVGDLVEKR